MGCVVWPFNSYRVRINVATVSPGLPPSSLLFLLPFLVLSLPYLPMVSTRDVSCK